MTHERSISVSSGQGSQKKNRRQHNIPSVVNKKRVNDEAAKKAFFGSRSNEALGRKSSPNRKNVTKSFGSVKAARKSAKKRSRSFNHK